MTLNHDIYDVKWVSLEMEMHMYLLGMFPVDKQEGPLI